MDQAAGPPTAPSGRRFGLVDFLIVVAGIAIALSILWDVPGLYEHILVMSFSDGSWTGEQFLRNWIQLIQSFSGLLAFLLYSASATILALNLRQPRQPLEHLACRPGFMANATVVALLVPGTLLAVKTLVIARLAYRTTPGYSVIFTDPRFLLTYALNMMPVPAALAVLASWLALILNRRWRPEPTWLDRAGRVVGWAWLVLAIL